MDYPRLLDTLAALHLGIQTAMDAAGRMQPADEALAHTTSVLEAAWLDARAAALAAFRRDDPAGYEAYAARPAGRDGKPFQR